MQWHRGRYESHPICSRVLRLFGVLVDPLRQHAKWVALKGDTIYSGNRLSMVTLSIAVSCGEYDSSVPQNETQLIKYRYKRTSTCNVLHLTLAPREEALNSKSSTPHQERIYVGYTVCQLQWSKQGVVFCAKWKLVLGLSTQGVEEQGAEHLRRDEAPNIDQPEPLPEDDRNFTAPHHIAQAARTVATKALADAVAQGPV